MSATYDQDNVTQATSRALPQNLRAFRLICAPIAFVLTCQIGQAQALPRLRVQKVVLPPSSYVQFSASDPLPLLPEQQPELDNITESGSYHFGVNTDDIEWVSGCPCFRYYVFFVQSSSGGAVHRFKVRAEPHGTFQDHWHIVDFELEGERRPERGQILLPLGSGDPLNVLVQTNVGVQIVHLNGESVVSVQLRHSLGDVSLQANVGDIDPNDGALWKSPFKLMHSGQMRAISAGDESTISYQVEPKPLEAAQRSLVHLKMDQEHAIIPFAISYSNPKFKNRQGVVNGKLRVRFVPTFPFLIAALIGGLVLGALLRLPAIKKHGTQQWASSTLTGLVAAACLWVLGLFLVGQDSRLVLFGYDVDPWQPLPTCMLGLICGVLGSESVAAVRRALKPR